MTKKELRKEILEHRSNISADAVKAMGVKINDNLKSLTHFSTVMVYLPTGTECDIWEYIRYLLREGITVYAPICLPDAVMRPALLRDLEKDLEVGKYGILAPKEEGRIYGDEGDLDAVIVPGVGFDVKGNRLGFGVGYYDRFLPKTKPSCRKIAVCYELQLKETVFPEDHDFPVDIIVTEKGVYPMK